MTGEEFDQRLADATRWLAAWFTGPWKPLAWGLVFIVLLWGWIIGWTL